MAEYMKYDAIIKSRQQRIDSDGQTAETTAAAINTTVNQ